MASAAARVRTVNERHEKITRLLCDIGEGQGYAISIFESLFLPSENDRFTYVIMGP